MRRWHKSLFGFALLVATSASAGILPAEIEPSITFQGRPVRFAMGERPYYSGRSAMVPLRTVCLSIGAGVRSSKDGRQWTVTRGQDRIECSVGAPWFMFNGVRQTMREAPEARDRLLFVPLELLQAISGGGLDVRATFDTPKDAVVYFGDRLLHFKQGDAPFRDSGTVFVSLRPTAAMIGAKVEVKDNGIRITITRSRDRLVHDLGTRWYLFNEVQSGLRTESVLHGRTMYVPIELFQALVGEQLRSR
jgi:hypothetical protein